MAVLFLKHGEENVKSEQELTAGPSPPRPPRFHTRRNPSDGTSEAAITRAPEDRLAPRVCSSAAPSQVTTPPRRGDPPAPRSKPPPPPSLQLRTGILNPSRRAFPARGLPRARRPRLWGDHRPPQDSVSGGSPAPAHAPPEHVPPQLGRGGRGGGEAEGGSASRLATTPEGGT